MRYQLSQNTCSLAAQYLTLAGLFAELKGYRTSRNNGLSFFHGEVTLDDVAKKYVFQGTPRHYLLSTEFYFHERLSLELIKWEAWEHGNKPLTELIGAIFVQGVSLGIEIGRTYDFLR